MVFWGADSGPAPLGDPPKPVVEQFARGMALADALEESVLLCYEMNGAPLHPAHGFPVRLLAPGWYGVANVKWLRRIEILDTAYAGRYMTREYVTQRTMVQDGQESVKFTLVGRALLKSAPARVVRGERGYRVEGVAWHAPIDRVEVRIDSGPWQQAYFVGDARPRGLRVATLGPRPGAVVDRGAHRHVARLRPGWERAARAGGPEHRHQANLLGEQRPDHPHASASPEHVIAYNWGEGASHS